MIMLPVRDAHLTGVQQQQRRKRSTAQASAEYARQKFLRRQRAAAAPVPLRALPWHQSLNRWPVEEYSTGWARDCSKCGSRLLDVEKDGWCCGQGRWRLDLLEPYPADFADFLDQNGRALQNQSRTLNNIFAFSAIGYTGQQLRFSGPQNVVITGRVYHRMLDLDADQGSLWWFLFDEQGHYRAGAQQNVPAHMVAACKALLESCSPYIRTLRHAVQTAGPLHFDLHLDQAVAGREVAAIVNPYNMHEVRCRKIVVAHRGKLRPDFVDILSPLYEPLQYPLLFPFGDAGWSREGSRLFEPTRSQCQWYRFRLLRKRRFLQFGRLTCEYLVDMYCRIEDERLQYLREGKTRQAREVFAAGEEEDTQEKDDYEMELQRAFAGVLPSSFLGSRAWTSERIADALALCRIYGKPSLFITMTTNPKWPEILCRLTKGQTAADVPVIVCRVFHNRLAVLKKFLRERFGCVVYTITVVEFQKRGLPHAHLLIKVFPEILVHHIDDIVSTELPLGENEKDKELRRLVEEFM
jgi:hypothetical protein